MIDSAVTLLPLPDSPTTPSVVRGATSNDTPSTARTAPSPVRNSVTRSRISSSGVDGEAGAAMAASLPARRADQQFAVTVCPLAPIPGMRIIKALSLSLALLVPVAALAAPSLTDRCSDPDCCPCCPNCPDCPQCPHGKRRPRAMTDTADAHPRLDGLARATGR